MITDTYVCLEVNLRSELAYTINTTDAVKFILISLNQCLCTPSNVIVIQIYIKWTQLTLGEPQLINMRKPIVYTSKI